MTAQLEAPHTTAAVEWHVVCPVAQLLRERGVAALVPGAGQVAVFRLADGSVRVVGNRDPFSGANVMSRGIVGTRAGSPTVASPMYKQVFDLVTGRCLDDEAVALPTYASRVHAGMVFVAVAAR
ncbi:nitrite reductase small subunit NirD [Motilibacter deserti]|uniref:Nitrite reductase small subunit NirD n=1 Tax=Motilibacter deserti TaxID=2714956 RepID=A0ABX0H118_9ACTN|nr:nitrite reductase small subunit NirD [Motilibacter deserti]